jgi:3-oxoacyl-(acyl-carrier-protein) synthase
LDLILEDRKSDRRDRHLVSFLEYLFPMQARRVVVTGLGLLSPLGTSVSQSWTRLIAGESGTVSLLAHPFTSAQREEFAALPSTVAGIVPDSKWLSLLSRDDRRRMGRFAQLAVAASEEALRDAQLTPKDLSVMQRERIVRPPKASRLIWVGCLLWLRDWEF